MCVHLTGEGYDAYGRRLLDDYATKEIIDDLDNGLLDFSQAVCLAIGNSVINVRAPWWDFDRPKTDPRYFNAYEVPDVPPAAWFDSRDYTRFYEKTKYIADKYGTYMLCCIWGSGWEKAYFLRGLENFLADIAGEPQFAKLLMDFIYETNLSLLPDIAANPALDAILLGSDWGTQKELIMSPKSFDYLLKDGERREYELIHNAGKDVFVHSCGNIMSIFDRITELKVDVLNPVQPECMDIAMLKERYGDKISFWGAISTQRTLPYGTPDEVRRETADVIKLLGKKGGYITAPSQEIQTDVPYENLRALIDTAREYAGL